MQETATVQESRTGTTHVAHPADIGVYEKTADPRSAYVEFDVPASSVKPTGAPGVAKIVGPSTIEGRLAARKGLPIPQMPPATNIEHVASKLRSLPID